MATQIGNGVRLHGYNFEEWIFTFNAATDILTLHNAATTTAIGALVELDSTAALLGTGTVKLASDGGTIFGRIVSVEQRKQEGTQLVGVALKFMDYVPQTAVVITQGTSIQGGGTGKAKTVAANGQTIALETTLSTDTQVLVLKL